jgi:riboflavin kinase/FMN adenylyltransferase
MKIHRGIESLPKFKNAVLTVGTYDGVHLGHKFILNRLQYLAEEINGVSILLTFLPHPRLVLYPHIPLFLISTLEEKLELLAKIGIDHVVIMPFTAEFASIDAEEYISKILVENFHPSYIVVGYDHRYGKDRRGDMHLLQHYAEQFHYKVEEIPAQTIDDISVSSTKVRQAVMDGNIIDANALLAHPYNIKGLVVHGDKLGRTIGFPTANIAVSKHKLVPALGVYACIVEVDDEKYMGALSISYRPTVTDSRDLRIEVYILDFESDIYDKEINLTLYYRIREDKKFEHIDSMVAAIHEDVAIVRKLISSQIL